LNDPDAVIRARAIRSVATDAGFGRRAAILGRLLRDDPEPAVRKLVLALLSEHMPEQIAGIFPDVLLDRAASIRGLARFVASTHQLALAPREFYVRALADSPQRQLGPAIQGVGETGTHADAERKGRANISPVARRARLGAPPDIVYVFIAQEGSVNILPLAVPLIEVLTRRSAEGVPERDVIAPGVKGARQVAGHDR
jgi:hypothetical protein